MESTAYKAMSLLSKMIPIVRNALLAAVIFICATNSYATENLIRNGGFEELADGFPTGWVPFQAGQERASFEVTSDQSIFCKGNISIRLTNLQEGSLVGISQELRLSPGSYVLSCYVRTEEDKVTYFSLGAGSAISGPKVVVRDVWLYHAFEFEVEESDSLSIIMQSHAEVGLPVWIDDVKVRMQHFGERVDLGSIESKSIVEASGIAASRKNANVLWTHNDSGDRSYIYSLNSVGRHLGRYYVSGASSSDWEDMAIGPGPVDGEHYIYIGDIGDNSASRELKRIYRVLEPNVDFNQSPLDTTISGAETITFRYPDGKRDAETLMVDPLTKDIYVVSKRETRVGVYRTPYPQSTTETITLEHVATLDLSGTVGGDISPSGLEILIKTNSTIYYWRRSPEQKLWQAFDDDPFKVPYIPEPQGEAVCWDPEGLGYYTISEGSPTHLYFYPRLDITSVVDNEEMPACFLLEQNYPNPFNSTTQITFSVLKASHVKIAIYNVLGQLACKLADGEYNPGIYHVKWDGMDSSGAPVSSGVYLYRMTIDSGERPIIKEMILLK